MPMSRRVYLKSRCGVYTLLTVKFTASLVEECFECQDIFKVRCTYTRNYSLSIKSYAVDRLAKSRHKVGGVVKFVRNAIDYRIRDDVKDNLLEFLYIQH